MPNATQAKHQAGEPFAYCWVKRRGFVMSPALHCILMAEFARRGRMLTPGEVWRAFRRLRQAFPAAAHTPIATAFTPPRAGTSR